MFTLSLLPSLPFSSQFIPPIRFIPQSVCLSDQLVCIYFLNSTLYPSSPLTLFKSAQDDTNAIKAGITA